MQALGELFRQLGFARGREGGKGKSDTAIHPGIWVDIDHFMHCEGVAEVAFFPHARFIVSGVVLVEGEGAHHDRHGGILTTLFYPSLDSFFALRLVGIGPNESSLLYLRIRARIACGGAWDGGCTEDDDEEERRKQASPVDESAASPSSNALPPRSPLGYVFFPASALGRACGVSVACSRDIALFLIDPIPEFYWRDGWLRRVLPIYRELHQEGTAQHSSVQHSTVQYLSARPRSQASISLGKHASGAYTL